MVGLEWYWMGHVGTGWGKVELAETWGLWINLESARMGPGVCIGGTWHLWLGHDICRWDMVSAEGTWGLQMEHGVCTWDMATADRKLEKNLLVR